VNPHWTIKNAVLAKDHPVTRGVQPFEINDEWYFFMRFRPEMKGVTPILSAVAPPETMSRGDGSHSGNKHVRESVKRGDLQALCWAAERDGGGRGFGFTGGHVHWNWGNDDFRKLILNAISWIAKAEVPEGGVSSKTPSREDLEANQDEPKPSR
jgi:type 1 glutamine amidotransferase